MDDDFIDKVAHEIAAPATAIKGYLRLINDTNPPFTEVVREYFADLNEAGEHLSELVDNLLVVVRAKGGRLMAKMVELDLFDVFEHCMSDLDWLAERRNVDITSGFEKGIMKVRADEQMLILSVKNMISNAIKFNRFGGSVIVNAKREDAMTKLTVSDTGYGIKQEFKEKLFLPFAKARGDNTIGVSGSGLGLYVLKILAESMEGDIEYNSIEGEGSEFILKLNTV